MMAGTAKHVLAGDEQKCAPYLTACFGFSAS